MACDSLGSVFVWARVLWPPGVSNWCGFHQQRAQLRVLCIDGTQVFEMPAFVGHLAFVVSCNCWRSVNRLLTSVVCHAAANKSNSVPRLPRIPHSLHNITAVAHIPVVPKDLFSYCKLAAFDISSANAHGVLTAATFAHGLITSLLRSVCV